MAAMNPAAPLGPFAVSDDQDGETGAPDTPKATLGHPSLSTAPTGSLPAVPLGTAASGDPPVQAFQGARELLDASNAVQDWAQGKTPSSEPPAIRWNPSFGPNGAHWSDSAVPGTGSFHDPSELNGFLRPTTGPLSAAAIAARNAYPLSPIPVPRPDIGPAIYPSQGSAPGVPSAPSAVLKTPAAAAAAANSQGSLDGSKPSGASTPGAGVTVGGRHLDYGAMVGGVPTFSDGSNGIARTMTDDQIKSLGNRLNIATAPLAPLASDALGYTPSSAQMVGQDLSQLRRYQPVTGSRPTPADFAAAERNNIASGDWRSAAGTVAHNLRMDAAYGGRTEKLAAQQGLEALYGGVKQGQQDAASAQDIADKTQAAAALENLRGQWGMASNAQQAALGRYNRGKGAPLTLADGTTGFADPTTGVFTPLKLANGSAAKAVSPKDQTRTNAVMDQITRGALQFAKNWMPPADNPKATPPYAQFRQQAAQAAGLPVAAQPGKPTLVKINGQWETL